MSAVVTDEAIRRKVVDYLNKSAALEKRWQRPITAQQLQAEMNRISTQTKDSATLRELFRALGDDPFVIAETLVRQTLADRLIRNWYGTDPRFHGNLRSNAESALATCADALGLRSIGGEYREIKWRRASSQVERPEDVSRSELLLGADEWRDLRTALGRALGVEPDEPLPARRVGALEDRFESFVARAVLSEQEDEIVIASVSWQKRSFDSWWNVERNAPLTEPAGSDYGFTMLTMPSGECVNDSWTPTRIEVPDPRLYHAAVWTGTEMIVWGGLDAVGGKMNSGRRYNPATDTWTFTSTGTNVPSGRSYHSAVWTGNEMIVWGGVDDFSLVNSGGRYAPATDTWLATSGNGPVPAPRDFHTAIWTGTQMVIWGGDTPGRSNSGGRYDPIADSWASTSLGANVPAPRDSHTSVWTGSNMLVWGGSGSDGSALNSGGIYDPSKNLWFPISTANAGPGRSGHTAVWTGTEMIVWSGSNGGNTGRRYNPSSGVWAATSTGANVPAQRVTHTAVWTGTEMLIWGGRFAGAWFNSGGRYDPSTDSWRATSTGTNVPLPRQLHSAVWTGNEMIVWGGSNNPSGQRYSNTGGRYDPNTDTWVPTSVGTQMTSARFGHASVWTGAEMLIWGGHDGFGVVRSGGRYNPSLDASTAMSDGSSVPDARASHNAVWTGAQMIIWGGQSLTQSFNSGGRYTPVLDSWAPTSTGANVPTARESNTAVWTGTELIIWGGSGPSYLNTGSRYDPSADVWLPTSMANTPLARQYHSAVWSGTEMIVWGGYNNGYLNSGGRYDPVSNTWTPTSMGVGVPQARLLPTAA